MRALGSTIDPRPGLGEVPYTYYIDPKEPLVIGGRQRTMREWIPDRSRMYCIRCLTPGHVNNLLEERTHLQELLGASPAGATPLPDYRLYTPGGIGLHSRCPTVQQL